ncbi:hypothetical protein K9M74_02990 [Candidatus Woesearchaeota archaeon]|nr:hypothetical protein [Candidatus Woesearchaeota archaeon]
MVEIKGRIINLSKEKSQIGYGFVQTQDKYYKITYNKHKFSLKKGDIVQIEGEKSPEETSRIKVNNISIIHKNQTILPNNDYFKNPKNQTNRYLDLICNPESFEFFKKRNQVIRRFREYLWNKDFDEVETGILKSKPYASKADSFKTEQKSTKKELFLKKTSEIELKKLLIGGFERVFEIGKIFRNEGKSKKQLPEFSCVDILMKYSDYKEMADIGKELFSIAYKIFEEEEPKFQTRIFSELLKQNGYTPTGTDKDFRIFNKKIMPLLEEPTIIYNFPHTLTPLSKKSELNEKFLEDFKICYNGMGIMHGHSLETSVDQIIINENNQIEELGLSQEEVDLSGRETLKYGLPPTSGLSLGIEKILLGISNKKDARDTTYFPLF